MSYPLQKDCAFLQSHVGQPCQTNDKKKSHRTVTFLFMACPAGFEPVTLRVGVSRAIQLCHGQRRGLTDRISRSSANILYHIFTDL